MEGGLEKDREPISINITLIISLLRLVLVYIYIHYLSDREKKSIRLIRVYKRLT